MPRSPLLPRNEKDREWWRKHLAESAREIGILLGTFGFLDAVLHNATTDPKAEQVHAWWIFGMIVLGVLFWLQGMEFESRNRKR